MDLDMQKEILFIIGQQTNGGFLLISYKGGRMSSFFKDISHTCGVHLSKADWQLSVGQTAAGTSQSKL